VDKSVDVLEKKVDLEMLR